jgi:hypothetical protein
MPGHDEVGTLARVNTLTVTRGLDPRVQLQRSILALVLLKKAGLPDRVRQ